MNKEELQALAKVVTKDLKTEQDLNEFSEMPTKITVEAALNAVLDRKLPRQVDISKVEFSSIRVV